MTRYERNINQVNADFTAIKNKLIEAGADIPAGTPTAEYAEKVGELYDAGRQAEYDAFWDAKQPKQGAATTMNANFGGHWTEETFKPKYDIVPTSCPYLFYTNSLKIDLVEHLAKIGRKLDFSKCSNMNSCFTFSNFTHLGNVSGLGQGNYYVFQGCRNLVTIDEWGHCEGGDIQAAGLLTTFDGCTALENITIKGKFLGDIRIHWSTKLTKASIISIVNALAGVDANVTGKTLTLSKEAVDREFRGVSAADFVTIVDGSNSLEWDTLMRTKPNWTITLT